jgi:hypothetical protein
VSVYQGSGVEIAPFNGITAAHRNLSHGCLNQWQDLANALQPWNLILVTGNCYNFCSGILKDVGALRTEVNINMLRN